MGWAVLVIDMQRDYCASDGALAQRGMGLEHSDAWVDAVERLISYARRVRIPVFWVRTEHSVQTDSTAWSSRRLKVDDQLAVSDAPICQPGSPGAEFYALSPSPQDSVVVKHRYSAFVGTDLMIRLRALDVNQLAIAGTATEVCVESTIRDAFQRDFYTVAIADGCISSDHSQHLSALMRFERFFGRVLNVDDMKVEWESFN